MSAQRRIIGVDLSTSTSDTALCVIEWSVANPIAEVRSGVGLQRIVGAQPDGTLAIDCPFGWPNAFVDFVVQRRDGEAPASYDRRPLQLRATDAWVESVTGKRPLSVSADKLGSTAMYCADLLDRIDPNLDRTGGDGVIEVYPAASLIVWGHDAKDGFDELVQTVGLTFSTESQSSMNQHCRDAVVCALTARAFDLELIQQPDEGIPDEVQQEGWIVLPAGGSLEKLRIAP